MTTDTKERGILFKRDMVIAIRDDYKTNTRRTKGLEEINKEPSKWTFKQLGCNLGDNGLAWFVDDGHSTISAKCPYGLVGDFLWVRETWGAHPDFDDLAPRDIPTELHLGNDSPFQIFYAADKDEVQLEELKPWRSPLHLPRRFARLLLKITDIRPERLLDISEEDARAEGVIRQGDFFKGTQNGFVHTTAKPAFFALWDSINGDGAVLLNPWCWRIEFEKVTTDV